METRHAAAMLHTQSIVDDANKMRDHLTATLREIILADSLNDARTIAREALANIKP
jgi:hypothetical protein